MNIEKAEIILNKETWSFVIADYTDYCRLYVKIWQDWIKAKKEYEREKRRLKMLKEVEVEKLCNTPVEWSITEKKPEWKLYSKTLAQTMIDIQFDEEDTSLLEMELNVDMIHIFWKTMDRFASAIKKEIDVNFRDSENTPTT